MRSVLLSTTFAILSVISSGAQSGLDAGARVTVLQPDPLMKLSQPYRVVLDVHGFKVTNASVDWAFYSDGVLRPFAARPSAVTLKQNSDGTDSFEVIPPTVGRARLRIVLWFNDGLVASKSVSAQIVYPDERPSDLVVATRSGYDEIDPILKVKITGDKVGLFPGVVYGQAKPIPIPAADVVYRVMIPAGQNQVLDINPSTGLITPLHLGHALVETRFRESSTLTCVSIVENLNLGSASHCDDILPSGRQLPVKRTQLIQKLTPIPEHK